MKNSFYFFLLISLINRIKLNKIIIKDFFLRNNEFYLFNPFLIINNESILEIGISWENNFSKENNDKLENFLVFESKLKENHLDIVKNPFFYKDQDYNLKIVANNKKEILLANISYYYQNFILNNKNDIKYQININNTLADDKLYLIFFYSNIYNDKNNVLFNLFIKSNEKLRYKFPYIQNNFFIILLVCFLSFIINSIYCFFFLYKRKFLVLTHSNSLFLIISFLCYFFYIILFLLFNKIFEENIQFSIFIFYISQISLIISNNAICFYYFLISFGFSLNLQNKIFKIKNDSLSLFEQLKKVKFKKFKNFIIIITLNSIFDFMKNKNEINYFVEGKNESYILFYRNINFFLSCIIWEKIYLKIKKKYDSINKIINIKSYFNKALFNIKILITNYYLQYFFFIINKWENSSDSILFILYIFFSQFKYLFIIISSSYLVIKETPNILDNINIEMSYKKNKSDNDLNIKNNYELVDNIISSKYTGIKSE